jgi:hypothetical protein
MLISYQYLLSKPYHRPEHLIHIVEYHRKIILKLNIFTGTRTEDSFRVVYLSSCNLFAEINNFVLCAILLSCLVSELQKPSSLGIEPGQFFGVVTFVSVISSWKQTTLVLAPFFYRA